MEMTYCGDDVVKFIVDSYPVTGNLFLTMITRDEDGDEHEIVITTNVNAEHALKENYSFVKEENDKRMEYFLLDYHLAQKTEAFSDFSVAKFYVWKFDMDKIEASATVEKVNKSE